MTPIAISENPLNDQETLAFTEASNKALDVVIEGLKIPDKDDREYRVVKDRGNSKTAIIAYTIGPDEYGKGPFYPSQEMVRSTGEKVLGIFRGLGIDTVEMQAWKDTAFVLRNPEDETNEEEKIPSPPNSLNEVGRRVEGLRISLALSPQAISATTIGPSTGERQPLETRGVFETAENNLSDLIREVIHLPEKVMIEIDTLECLAAETDIAADVDLSMAEGEKMSPEEIQFLARAIMDQLNNNPNTQDGIATVWIRQGQPEVTSITSDISGN